MYNGKDFNLPFYIAKFLRYLKRNNFSEETVVAYTKDLNIFSSYLYNAYDGRLLVEQILRHDLFDYLAYLQEEKQYKQTSVYRHLSTLKSFYRFLVNEMNFRDNIAGKIRHQHVYTPLPEILTEEEVERLFKTAHEYSVYFCTIIKTLYYTGSRITATLLLEKKDIDFNEGKIYFKRIKGGRDLYLPIHQNLQVTLAMFLKQHPAPKLRKNLMILYLMKKKLIYFILSKNILISMVLLQLVNMLIKKMAGKILMTGILSHTIMQKHCQLNKVKLVTLR